ncbi:hypothetical protein EON64_10995 [archaeon]|nr:MAG: hypothetical protein EON64_10995 [archaeon]
MLHVLVEHTGHGAIAERSSGGTASEAKLTYLLESLKSESLSPDALDCSGSYFILLMLEGLGVVSSQEDRYCVCSTIRLHYVQQLLAAGHFQHAAFVALQLPSESQRTTVVENVLSLWIARQYDSRTQSLHDMQAYCTLRLPLSLFHRLAARHARYHKAFDTQVFHLLEAQEGWEAREVLAECVAPLWGLHTPKKRAELLAMLEGCREEGPGGLGELLLRYLRLRDLLDGVEEKDEQVAQELRTLLLGLTHYRSCQTRSQSEKLPEMLEEVASDLLQRLADLESLTACPSTSLAMALICKGELQVLEEVREEAVQTTLRSFLACAADNLVV